MPGCSKPLNDRRQLSSQSNTFTHRMERFPPFGTRSTLNERAARKNSKQVAFGAMVRVNLRRLDCW